MLCWTVYGRVLVRLLASLGLANLSLPGCYWCVGWVVSISRASARLSVANLALEWVCRPRWNCPQVVVSVSCVVIMSDLLIPKRIKTWRGSCAMILTYVRSKPFLPGRCGFFIVCANHMLPKKFVEHHRNMLKVMHDAYMRLRKNVKNKAWRVTISCSCILFSCR